MDRRTISLKPEVYGRLSFFKAREGTRRKRPLDWDEFFGVLLDRERRKREILSWAYAALIFIAITFILLWPVYFYSPALIPLVWAVGLVIAAVTVYFLTPFVLRKVKLLEGAAEVHRWLAELAAKAGLKKTPKIKVFDTPEVNALAYCTVSGGVICLTRGLLDAYREGTLSSSEFKAILAHEIGHLKHQDLMKFNLALAWVGVFEFFGTEVMRVGIAMADAAEGDEGWWGIMLMLAAWFALLLGSALSAIAKLASALSFHLSRRQELEADELGGELTHPEAMAAALEKIDQLNARLVAEELEKLPFPDRWQLQPRNRSWVERLWDTHPPTPSRVGRQRALAEFLGHPPE